MLLSCGVSEEAIAHWCDTNMLRESDGEAANKCFFSVTFRSSPAIIDPSTKWSKRFSNARRPTSFLNEQPSANGGRGAALCPLARSRDRNARLLFTYRLAAITVKAHCQHALRKLLRRERHYNDERLNVTMKTRYI